MIPTGVLTVAYKTRAQVRLFLGKRPHLPLHKDLCGACAIASYLLVKNLKKAGYKSSFVTGEYEDFGNHCWTEYSNYIIDITASQFGLAPVYVTHVSNWRYSEVAIGATALQEVRFWGPQAPQTHRRVKELKAFNLT